MKPIFSRLLPKGSVLVFSLIILSVMLVTALSLLSSAVLDQRASLSTADSTRSFQIADSGVEQTLYQVYRKNPGTIGEIASGMGLSCDAGTITDASAGWTVRFYDSDGSHLSDCDADRGDIAALKSEGSASGTTRAVEVAVAAAQCKFTFIDPTVNVVSYGGNTTGSGTFDVSSYIDSDATAVVLESEGALGEPDHGEGDVDAHVKIRQDSTGSWYVLLRGRCAGRYDECAFSNQGIFPVSPSGTFDWRVEAPGFEQGVTVRLIGFYSC